MKNLFSKMKVKLGAVVAGVVAGSGLANAAVTLPTQVETADVLAFAGIILLGIAAIWPVKKLIALGNKS